MEQTYGGVQVNPKSQISKKIKIKNKNNDNKIIGKKKLFKL